MKSFEHRHLNSMFKWYPLIENVVPTPKTVLIPQMTDWQSFDAALSAIYGGESDPEMQRLIDEANKAAQQLGGYPVFLRSDETSNKHEWNHTCYATSKEALAKGIANILEFTLMAMELSFNGVVVREFLSLPHEFHAFNGMPVSQEFRFFVKNGEVQCRHPYWFPSCLRRVDCENWLPKLREIQVLTKETEEMLDGYALAVSRAVESLGAPENFWSIDFCCAKGKGWLVTDMALGEDSYHYSTCPFAPEEMKRYPDPENMAEVTTLLGIKNKLKKFKNNPLNLLSEDEQL